jgi:hypothetical protein
VQRERRTIAHGSAGALADVEIERGGELVDAFGALDVRRADIEALLRLAGRRVTQADANEHEQQLECCRPTSQTGAISRFAIKPRARSHSLSFGFF